MSALSLLCVLLSAPPAASIPWAQVIGAPEEVTDAQRATAAEILNAEFSYHGCADTLAACLKDPEGATARRVAGMVLRQLAQGRDPEVIRVMILDRARSAHPLKPAALEPPEEDVSLGAKDAPLVIVEFADFQCPFCRVISPMMERLITGPYKGKARFSFRHFPVKGHERAPQTAVASLAAARQGKFFPYHDLLYKNRHALSDEDLLDYARQVGLDMARFKADLKDKALLERVRAEKREGARLGVDRTPTLFFNGKRLFLKDLDEAELRDRVEEELELLGVR
ncbi:DsbA family protein [Myxococcota bacterium]|nr:DsbA family protein [Myxococcota bacterium]MBU1430296.1 DsbA family protein [Myxococcota bacterium]MBU1896260.1 DsbA family protein [Myxococcota bacterium]